MHVACIQGRADVVQLLITYAEEKLLKTSLKSTLNAKSKVSVGRWILFQVLTFPSHDVYPPHM